MGFDLDESPVQHRADISIGNHTHIHTYGQLRLTNVEGSWGTRGEPTQTRGEHADSTRKGVASSQQEARFNRNCTGATAAHKFIVTDECSTESAEDGNMQKKHCSDSKRVTMPCVCCFTVKDEAPCAGGGHIRTHSTADICANFNWWPQYPQISFKKGKHQPVLVVSLSSREWLNTKLGTVQTFHRNAWTLKSRRLEKHNLRSTNSKACWRASWVWHGLDLCCWLRRLARMF